MGTLFLMFKGAKVYGLTGGISTGKSTVGAYFQELGVVVIDADRVSRDVCQKGEKGLFEICEVFGKGILTHEGELDREKLSKIIFKDPTKRKQLEAITHPLIMENIRHQIRTFQEQGKVLILVEAALIFEAGYEKEFEGVIVVTCRPEQQMERCLKKGHLSKPHAKRIIEAQLPIAKKVKKASFVIDNSGTPQQTKEYIKELLKKL